MSNFLRIVLVILIGPHGLGHILFLVPLLGVADWGRPAHSWLLGDGWPAKGIGSLIWLAAIIGFMAAAIGLLTATDWWRTVAIIAAAVSILGLLLFWANPPGSPVLSALFFNLLVIVMLLVLHWPPVPQPN